VPTVDVFRRYAGDGAAFSVEQAADGLWDGLANATELAERLAETRNDLEAPAIALVPEIEVVLGALRDTEACLFARMSGSGATCFALYADDAGAQAAAARLRGAHPHWWVMASRLRSVAPKAERA